MSEFDRRVVSRIPRGGSYLDMNINDYIASSTDESHDPLSKEIGISESLEKAIGMYAYLRDNTGARTVREALNALVQRRIDPKIVKLWVEEGFCVNPKEYDAVKAGYPEYVSILKTVRNKTIDQILER